MADETKTEAVRLAVLEVKVDNIEKRVDGMEAVIQDIREVLVELRNKNPINEFLQKYWKHMIAIVVLYSLKKFPTTVKESPKIKNDMEIRVPASVVAKNR